MNKWTNEDLVSQLITRANQVSIISESNEIAEMKSELLRRLSALDTPATPPEDARELARTIVIDSRRINNTVRDTIDYSARLISSYADSIRKQCADLVISKAVELGLLSDTEDDEDARALRAAIMRKE